MLKWHWGYSCCGHSMAEPCSFIWLCGSEALMITRGRGGGGRALCKSERLVFKHCLLVENLVWVTKLSSVWGNNCEDEELLLGVAFRAAGWGGGPAGPAAGGGVPAAGRPGTGVQGPRVGPAHRPERVWAHQRRGAEWPGAPKVLGLWVDPGWACLSFLLLISVWRGPGESRRF